MKPLRRSALVAAQAGLSLIELMVSITIGLVLMIAVTSAYLGSSGATNVAAAQGRMNEDAQAALSILSQQIRMAGDNPKQPNYTEPTTRNPAFDATVDPFGIRGCNLVFSNVTSAASVKDLTCAGSPPHSIAVRYEADINNTIPSAGKPTDCMGAALTAVTPTPQVKIYDLPSGAAAKFQKAITPTFYVADNRFYVKKAAGVSSLYCKGNGGAEQPLVENIEDLQFVYGTAKATGTMTMAGYLTADAVESNADLAALPDSAARWARVMTVKMCVQVRSDKPVGLDASTNQYAACFAAPNAAPSTSPDGFLRRTFYSTVVLRNRVPASD